MNKLIINSHLPGYNDVSLDGVNGGYFITIFDNNIEHSAYVLPDSGFGEPFARPTLAVEDSDKRKREVQFFSSPDVSELIKQITTAIFNGELGEKVLHHFSCTIHMASEIKKILNGDTSELLKLLKDSTKTPTLMRYLIKCEHHSELSDEREIVSFVLTTGYNLKFNPKAVNFVIQLIYPELRLDYDEESQNLYNACLGIRISTISVSVLEGVEPYTLANTQRFAFTYDKFKPSIKS